MVMHMAVKKILLIIIEVLLMKYSDNKDYKVIAFVTACIHYDATELRVKMMAKKCKENNCKVIFYSTQTDFVEDAHSEQIGNRETAIFDIIDVEKFDAIILMTETFKEHELKEKFVKRALDANVPVISVEERLDGCVNVAFDYKTPFRMIVKHMVEHHGYKKINFMGGFKGLSFADERLDIYREVLEENGIEYDERRVYYGDFWELPTIAAMDKMFEDWDEMPEAIICANDVMAITVCDCLKKKGYKVPEDIAVSGFDGMEVEKYHYPRLLTSGNNQSLFIDGMFKLVNSPELKVEEKDLLIPAYEGMQIGGSCGCKKLETVNAAEEMIKLKTDMQEQMIYQSRLGRTIVSSGNNKEKGMVEKIIPKHLGVLNYYDFWFVATHRLLTDSYLPMTEDAKACKNIIHYIAKDKGADVEYISDMKDYEIVPNFYEYLESDHPLLVMSVQNPEDEMGYAVIRFDDDKFKCLSYAGFLSHFRYLLEMIRMSKVAMDVYRNDALTEIMNRNGFYEKYQNIMRNNVVEEITVISMDLYKFKDINDTFGHAEGDIALMNVGRIINESLQKGEIGARFGGDEFLIVLYKANQRERKDEIIKSLEEKADEYNRNNRKDYKILFSIGTYTGNVQERNLDYILRQADKHMYKHKSEQRMRE